MNAPRSVAIVGAGLAGLVAALEAAAAGADVVVFERADEPGGATALSAGWIWRYRDLATARAAAPHGDPAIHAAVVEALDGDLDWLAARGVALVAGETGRSHTSGVRIDPPQAIATLVDLLDAANGEALQLRSEVIDARRSSDGRIELRTGRRRFGRSVDDVATWRAFDAVVFAGGGYAADMERIAAEAGVGEAASAAWVLRASTAGRGSSLDAALRLGAMRVPATGESLVRLVPTGPAMQGGDVLVRMGELQVPGSRVHDLLGEPIEQSPHDWAGAMVAWELARRSGEGVLLLDLQARRTRLPGGGSVEVVVREAIDHGAVARHLPGGRLELAVRAGITATRCGLRVDSSGRLLAATTGSGNRGEPGRRLLPIPDAFAAGIDAADPALGGIASGLALALVLGRRAGRAAAAPGT